MMKYVKRVYVRLLLLIIFLLVGYKVIYVVISPITFYLIYYSLFFYSPILTSSTSFVVNGQSVNFIPACTAASAYLLFLMLVLTVDIKFRKAASIFLTGSFLILFGNLVRVDILIISLIKYGYTLFETLHMFFWTVLSTIYVVLVWILLAWIFKIRDIPIYSDFLRVYKIFKRARKIYIL